MKGNVLYNVYNRFFPCGNPNIGIMRLRLAGFAPLAGCMFSDELDKIYRPQHPPAHRPMRVKAFFHHRFHRFESATPRKTSPPVPSVRTGPKKCFEPGISAGWKFLYPNRRSFFPAPGTAVSLPSMQKNPCRQNRTGNIYFSDHGRLSSPFRGGIL